MNDSTQELTKKSADFTEIKCSHPALPATVIIAQLAGIFNYIVEYTTFGLRISGNFNLDAVKKAWKERNITFTQC